MGTNTIIPVPASSGYPFLILISYPLRVLSADTNFFDIPRCDNVTCHFLILNLVPVFLFCLDLVPIFVKVLQFHHSPN